MSLRYEPIEVILTIEQLTELCVDWQYRLRLVDWSVSVRITTRNSMCMNGAEGDCARIPSLKIAKISVISPAHYESSYDIPQDMELTLVHELLHMHQNYGLPEEGTSEWNEFEAGIELIAQALVQLKREAQKPKDNA